MGDLWLEGGLGYFLAIQRVCDFCKEYSWVRGSSKE